MNPAALRRIVEDHIRTLEGNAFQDFCDRLCMKLYPDDYTPVRAAGPKGDMKNDGYCPKARIFFAAHATRGEPFHKTKAKITSDLEGCLGKHADVGTWTYLTNDTLAGEVEAHVDDLRRAHSNVTIEVWGHKRIAERVCRFAEPIVGEISGIAIEPTVEITGEIEHAASLLKKSKVREAICVLERLWAQFSDRMAGREKYRVRANLGHAYYALMDHTRAADCFLEAVKYDPTYEKARARETLAYLIKGNAAKAHSLSSDLLADSPGEPLARAVWIRSAPNDVAFGDLEESIPEYQGEDVEIQMALAEAAAMRDLHEIAKKHTSRVCQKDANSPAVKEAVANVIMNSIPVWDLLRQDRRASESERKSLKEACKYYSDALGMFKKQNLTSRAARVRLRRSEAYILLDEEKKADQDCILAYELDASNPEAVFKCAAIKAKHNDMDGAISLFETLEGRPLRASFYLCFAQVLCQRNRPEDKARALDMLSARVGDTEAEVEEIRYSCMSLVVPLKTELHGAAPALKLIDGLERALLSETARACLRGKVAEQTGDPEAVSSAVAEILESISEDTTSDDLRRAAIGLQGFGRFRDALSLWKRLVRAEYLGADTFWAIECAQRCGDAAYILDFAERLRGNGLWDRRVFELEICLREEYNDWKGCRQALQEYLENPADETYLPYARAHLSHVAGRLNEVGLIETNLALLPQPCDVEPEMGEIVVQSLRLGGEPEKAVDYAYELVRRRWDSLDAHLAVANFMVPIGPRQLEVKPELVVGPGVAVQYQEDRANVALWHIVEDSELGEPEPSRREYSVDHPYSQKMLGLKKGDAFLLRTDRIQERRATILEITSKY